MRQIRRLVWLSRSGLAVVESDQQVRLPRANVKVEGREAERLGAGATNDGCTLTL